MWAYCLPACCAWCGAEEWCGENLLREGIAPERASVLSVEDFDHLPFRSGSMDIVALPFVTCTSRCAGTERRYGALVCPDPAHIPFE